MLSRRKSACHCGAKHVSKSKCTKHTILGHFWKLRCGKSARRCGAKHISKSKRTKHLSPGALLEVVMSKKCTPLWREAHFQVKMYKTHHSRTTFGSWDVKKVHAVVARSTFRSQHVQNTPLSDHFWKLRRQKSARRCGAKHSYRSQKCKKLRGMEHFWTFRCFVWHAQGIVHLVKSEQNLKVLVAVSTTNNTTLDSTPLQLQLQHYTTLHSITLHHTTLHYNTQTTTTTTLRYTNYTTLCYTPFHFTTLHSITLHYNYNYNCNYTTAHYATLITLHYTNYITLHYTSYSYNYHYTILH